MTQVSKSISDFRDHRQEKSAACGEARKPREDVRKWVLTRDLTDEGVVDVVGHGDSQTQKSPEIGRIGSAPALPGPVLHET
jgi:hypothetical protein